MFRKIIIALLIFSISLIASEIQYSSYSLGEYRNDDAFAALKGDGSVIAWGFSLVGGNNASVAEELSSGVVKIFSSRSAFAALKDDGSVITWGSGNSGGDSSDVAEKLSSGVAKIFSTSEAFAALKDDGSVVTWGSSWSGGDSSSVSEEISSGVIKISSTQRAFAALRDDGSIVTWGITSSGGDSSSVADELSSGVVNIFSAVYAFAALKADGSVVAWGSDSYGGDSSGVAEKLTSGVVNIFSSEYAFAVLKNDGSVVTWGGYLNNCYDVPIELSSGVVNIFSAGSTFAALKDDGSVVTCNEISSSAAEELLSGVVNIFTNGYASAALKDNGSVVTWGSDSFGGDSSSVAEELSSGVMKISSSEYAFAALKSDGSVVTWGEDARGGDSSIVSEEISSGVVNIFSAGSAFAALKDNGSVVTWGSDSFGGDSSSVAEELSSGVICISNINDNCSDSEILLKKGWNLTSLPTSGRINYPDVSYIWHYDSNTSQWEAYPKTLNYKELNTTSSSKGYWVLAKNDYNQSFEGSSLESFDYNELQDGWYMLGSYWGTGDLSSIKSDSKIIWRYENGEWKGNGFINDMNNVIQNYGHKLFTSIPPKSGFWLLKYQNKAPYSDFLISPEKETYYINEEIDLTSVSYDTADENISLSWSTSLSKYENILTSYSQSGTYDINLTVTDERGKFSTTTKQIIVIDEVERVSLSQNIFPKEYTYTLEGMDYKITLSKGSNDTLNLNHSESDSESLLDANFVLQWHGKGYSGTSELNSYNLANAVIDGYNVRADIDRAKIYYDFDLANKIVKDKIFALSIMYVNNIVYAYLKLSNDDSIEISKYTYDQIKSDFDSYYNELEVINSDMPLNIQQDIFKDLGY